MTLYDAEGNAKEVMTDEEVKSTLEGKEKEIESVKKELEKLQNTDHNFKRLRDMTEKEKERLTATELALKEKQEKLEDDQKSFFERQVTEHKNDALNAIVGDDPELREKVLHHFDRIKDDAVTREEINKKMREASLLATGITHSAPSALGLASGLSGAGIKEKKQQVNQEVLEAAPMFGLTKEDIEKYG